MKKLLVILLLFFPVHGAWGKDKIYLKCVGNDDIRMIFIIDLEKKTMTNVQGLYLRNISITNIVFQGDIPLQSLNKVNKEIQGNQFLLKNQTYKIYPDDGVFNSTTVFTNGKRVYETGNCEQVSSKKKF